MAIEPELWPRYRLRIRRRRLLWRAFRSRRQLTPIADRTGALTKDVILAFLTIRNESDRLPFLLAHYRRLGIGHFLIVDNGSDDDSVSYLSDQKDVSLWQTQASYRQSRFGMDWLGWLLMRYGHNHWCLTLDADEILTYPHQSQRDLTELTGWLDQNNVPAFGAMLLDLYPKGRLGATVYAPGTDPTMSLPWFDPDGYTWELQQRYQNVSIRGGVRKRVFFKDTPDLAPHLHKIPLVKWHRRYAYASSTHLLLPRRLNAALDARRNLPSGILLHNKFLNTIIEKSGEERLRREHFTHAESYDSYYQSLVDDPILWSENAARYEGPEQLEALGLMTRGGWA